MAWLSKCGIAMALIARSVMAQAIPASVEAAEVEGASYPRAASPAYTPSVFTSEFVGTTERKCFAQPLNTTGGSLRSGEMILRTRLTGRWGLRAGRESKILWQPLHNPFEYPDTLLIRAVRIDSPADSLRLSIPNWGYSPGAKQESAFPSTVQFPTSGSWLVIATAGSDWGCFVLTVQPT